MLMLMYKMLRDVHMILLLCPNASAAVDLMRVLLINVYSHWIRHFRSLMQVDERTIWYTCAINSNEIYE